MVLTIYKTHFFNTRYRSHFYRPESASRLVREVDDRSAEELAASVLVVVEAGAVGRVLLTREGAANGQRNARPRRHFFKLLLQVQRLTHSAYR